MTGASRSCPPSLGDGTPSAQDTPRAQDALGTQDALGAQNTLGAQDELDTIEACQDCLRRSWLLAVLSARLAYHARDRARLLALLALGDEQLVQAIGGKRRGELRARYARFTRDDINWEVGVETICRHHPGYPRGLRLAGDRAPRMLYTVDGARRLVELANQPTVAIVGSRRATDYGMELARSLARGLAASGVTVAGSLSDGIAVAALAGAVEVDGKTLTVLDGGLDVGCPARRRALYRRLRKAGCAVAELPCGCGARQWCHTAREQTLAGLAELTIVVEADEDPGDLVGARVAKALGRTVAAVPGRVTSPASRGTHRLLMEGATLVRGPGDALELLYEGSPLYKGDPPRRPGGAPKHTTIPKPAELEPRLKETLEQVGAGRDTPAKLTAGSRDTGEALLALSELELMGLLTRGDGGRYVPRESLAGG
jgi:DNA processing protein